MKVAGGGEPNPCTETGFRFDRAETRFLHRPGPTPSDGSRCGRPTRQKSMDPTIKDFEAALAELDTIVKKLEEGDLTLEASLQLYERGVQLSRFCHAQLEQAERRIEILNERGQLSSAPTTLADGADPNQRAKGKGAL